jgi:CheY-like chemotaxis protein
MLERVVPRLKVLVADDVKDLLDVCCEFLASHDFEVVGTGSGAESLLVAKSFHPNVIVLDPPLPGTHPDSLLYAIRTDPDLAKTPVLLLSASVGHTYVFAPPGEEALTKHCSPDSLVAAITELAREGKE